MCLACISFLFSCSSDSDDMKADDNPVCISARETISQSEQFVSFTKNEYENDTSNASKCIEYRDALNALSSQINFLINQDCDGSSYSNRLEEIADIISALGC